MRFGVGTPERNQSLSDEVLSVPSPSRRQALARADSGNVRESRMTLSIEIANFITEAEYDDRATCRVFKHYMDIRRAKLADAVGR